MELAEISDQVVVNLVCELRPTAADVPLDGGEMTVQTIEWERLRLAEQELQSRGYTETSRGYWKSDDSDKPYLIHRPA